jgi:hypothetical protein
VLHRCSQSAANDNEPPLPMPLPVKRRTG